MTVNLEQQGQDAEALGDLDQELLGGEAAGQEAAEAGAPEEKKPTYEELLAERDAYKKREADAQAQIGRQGQELGDWRQRFTASQPAATPPSQSNLGPFSVLVDEVLAGVEDWNAKSDPRGFAEAIARGVQTALGRAYQQASGQQRAQAAFESEFWKAHEALKEGEAREVFNAMLQQEAAGGYHSTVPAVYEAAAKRTLDIFEALGLSYGEAAERGAKRAAGVHGPGPRGARPGGSATTGGNPEQILQALNASYRDTHTKSQAQLRRPSQAREKT